MNALPSASNSLIDGVPVGLEPGHRRPVGVHEQDRLVPGVRGMGRAARVEAPACRNEPTRRVADPDGVDVEPVEPRREPARPTQGPPGYPGESYIPLAVSFAMKSGERRRQGHLDYALSRSFWAKQHPPTPTEEDGETLRRLVLERLSYDLGVIDAGDDPKALRTNRTPKFLRP